MIKRTLILGATTNPSRYAYEAAHRLVEHNNPILLYGIKNGEVLGNKIEHNKDVIPKEIDTITLYIGSKHQPEWYDFILKTKPNRIIFNPGTENFELKKKAEKNNIECVFGCTLVMLTVGTY